MFAHSLSHLSDRELLQGLAALVARDRTTTAELLGISERTLRNKLNVPVPIAA